MKAFVISRETCFALLWDKYATFEIKQETWTDVKIHSCHKLENFRKPYLKKKKKKVKWGSTKEWWIKTCSFKNWEIGGLLSFPPLWAYDSINDTTYFSVYKVLIVSSHMTEQFQVESCIKDSNSSVLKRVIPWQSIEPKEHFCKWNDFTRPHNFFNFSPPAAAQNRPPSNWFHSV